MVNLTKLLLETAPVAVREAVEDARKKKIPQYFQYGNEIIKDVGGVQEVIKRLPEKNAS